jgi:hypothetical protein
LDTLTLTLRDAADKAVDSVVDCGERG